VKINLARRLAHYQLGIDRVDRRTFLGLLAWPILSANVPQRTTTSQGMSSRGVPPSPRGKPSGIPFHARFTDVAGLAGLKEVVVSGHPNRADFIIESMSAGAAFFDYDNDGWLDVLIVSGSRQGDPPAAATNRLYKNNRDGTFSDVTEKAGLFRPGYAYGVTVGDYNNDGFEDLFITYWGQNALYRNNGDGTFADVTKEAGLLSPEPRFGTGCAFLDYDRDGQLDLFVSNYVKFDMSLPRPGDPSSCRYGGVPVFCGPRGLPYGRHSLYHNDGDGAFTDVTVPSGIGKVDGGYGLTVVSADFDNDGWPDIYVACDSTPSLLFRNNHDGTFSEQGLERGVALSNDGMEQAGMGVAVGDFMLNGRLDIVKTHFSEDTLGVYRNDGSGTFWDVTRNSGLAVETRYVQWGVGLVDLDNDGKPDIFAVTGGVYPELRNGYKTPRIIFRNLGKGQFEQLLGLGPAVDGPHASRGCAFGDFDNDGDMDILIVNQNEPPSLLRNDVTGGNHWIKIKLIGTKSNRSAIGAQVIARYGDKVQAQEVLSQSSYLSANDRRLHFGLGTATTLDLEIRWPSGQWEKLSAVPTDQLISVTEGLGITATRKWAAA
jgi:hypothetical protein